METTNSYNDPALQQERFIVVTTANTPVDAGAESDVMASVSREGEYIALAPASSLPDGLKAVEHLSSVGSMTSCSRPYCGNPYKNPAEIQVRKSQKTAVLVSSFALY